MVHAVPSLTLAARPFCHPTAFDALCLRLLIPASFVLLSCRPRLDFVLVSISDNSLGLSLFPNGEFLVDPPVLALRKQRPAAMVFGKAVTGAVGVAALVARVRDLVVTVTDTALAHPGSIRLFAGCGKKLSSGSFQSIDCESPAKWVLDCRERTITASETHAARIVRVYLSVCVV